VSKKEENRSRKGWKRYLPIVIALCFVAGGALLVVKKKSTDTAQQSSVQTLPELGMFDRNKRCAVPPKFLREKGVSQPVLIDLSQKKYTGVALLYGRNFSQVYHPVQWERFGHLGTYAADDQGNLFLVPMPFISIRPTTFALQKNIYKIDTTTGKLSIFMRLDDVYPSANNPYGINSIVYDCDDKTLWVSAIDESDYTHQKGVIYHIDPQDRSVIGKIEGVDALSLALIHTDTGKYLLVGSARENALYRYRLSSTSEAQGPFVVLQIPAAEERIRKIRIVGKSTLELQTIPFSYALIARSVDKDRRIYRAAWDSFSKTWKIGEKR